MPDELLAIAIIFCWINWYYQGYDMGLGWPKHFVFRVTLILTAFIFGFAYMIFEIPTESISLTIKDVGIIGLFVILYALSGIIPGYYFGSKERAKYNSTEFIEVE